MNWRIVTLDDVLVMQKSAENNQCYANNYSSVNSFLYQKKFAAQICMENNWIFEKCIENGNFFYSFPHNIEGDNCEVESAVRKIIDDAEQSHCSCLFYNITMDEKNILTSFYPDAEVEEKRHLSDYIYLSEKLSKLPGKTYSKKRNHVNQFLKNYPDYKFETVNSENIQKILEIEENWLNENLQNQERSELSEDLKNEQKIISLAAADYDFFCRNCGMSGGILYVKNKPAAFCLASILSKDVTDVHFEKCLSEYAAAGGYAMINQLFAQTVSSKYINREEDLGIEGLRKAKLSYYPEKILEKYNITICH